MAEIEVKSDTMRCAAWYAVLGAAVLPFTMSAQSGYARPELLVDTAWLATHLSDPNLRIVDLRPRGYGDGHIPGAVWLDNNAIRIANRPPTFLPTPQEFEALMSSLGIGNNTRVIAYDERGGIYAARLWWILNYYGHANVALLDGGWTQWTADRRPTNAGAPSMARASFAVRAGTVKVATAQDVLDAINKPGLKLIDARTQGEIDGKDLRNIKRGGFIESSVPVYWEDTLDPATRTFKSAAEIQKLYHDRGIQAADDVITYCQIGMRASHDLFTLALIGHDLTKLRNYYGSWEEWGNRDDMPIKTK
jgi:thiosulfate/3-mercaptopyruvate sulfurtransferase